MSNNPAVSLILDPLLRMVQASQKPDEWCDRHWNEIEEEKAASISQAIDQHKFAVVDDLMIERSLNFHDPFHLITKIERAASALRDAGEHTVAN